MTQSITSPAAQVLISITPIVGIVFGAIILFFYKLWHHHEIKLQIKTGTFVPTKINVKAFSLLAGLLLTGVGTTVSVVFAILGGLSYMLLGGLIPTVIGICLLIFYRVYPKLKENQE